MSQTNLLPHWVPSSLHLTNVSLCQIKWCSVNNFMSELICPLVKICCNFCFCYGRVQVEFRYLILNIILGMIYHAKYRIKSAIYDLYREIYTQCEPYFESFRLPESKCLCIYPTFLLRVGSDTKSFLCIIHLVWIKNCHAKGKEPTLPNYLLIAGSGEYEIDSCLSQKVK